MEFTEHFKQMLVERQIKAEWIDIALKYPDEIRSPEDGTRHFIKQIEEHGGRWLRVIVNIETDPQRIITVFFDRRIRRQKNENQS